MQKLLLNINYSQNVHIFLPQVQTQLSISQNELFSHGNPFDSCLIMKNSNPRKWPTLLCKLAIQQLLWVSYRRWKLWSTVYLWENWWISFLWTWENCCCSCRHFYHVLTALIIQTKSDQIAPRIYFYVHLFCRHLGKYTILRPTKENTRVADPDLKGVYLLPVVGPGKSGSKLRLEECRKNNLRWVRNFYVKHLINELIKL